MSQYIRNGYKLRIELLCIIFEIRIDKNDHRLSLFLLKDGHQYRTPITLVDGQEKICPKTKHETPKN